jgi:hypothetical protein
VSKNNLTASANKTSVSRVSHRSCSKAADIVQRLPLHRSLSESQTMLVQLTPHWQLWLNQAADNGDVSSACRQNTQLEAWQASSNRASSNKASSENSKRIKPTTANPDGGKLIISCDNATNATQIKQLQQSLIDYLNKNLVQSDPTSTLIKTIAVRLRYDATPVSLNTHKLLSTKAMTPIAETSIRAIEICQKTVSNQDLAKSLQQLANTLRSLS